MENTNTSKKKGGALLIGGLALLLLTFAEATYLLIDHVFIQKNKSGNVIINSDDNDNPSDDNSDNSDADVLEKTYIITWLNDDNTVLEVDQDVKKGDTPHYDGTTPTKRDDGLIYYAFKGWNKELAPVEANTTFVATYDVAYHDANVVFDMCGHGEAIDPQSVTYGGYVTKPTDPTTEGYTFAGWYKEPSYTIPWNFATDQVTSSVTIYAKWDIISFTVSFDTSGSSTVIDDQIIPYGGKVEKPDYVEPPASNYSLTGWYYYDEDYEKHTWNFEEDVVTGNLTLIADWIIEK